MGSNSVQIEPLSPVIGAEVHGVDLARALDPPTFDALHDAWMEHLVLFFRDQPLDVPSLQALGRRFGKLHIHPQGDLDGWPGIIQVHTDAGSKVYSGRTWHSDVSCDEEPPAASILHLHQVPESGGDTLFCNAYAAFEALSPLLQEFLLGLRAHHSGERNYGGYFGTPREQTRDGRFPETVHPMVRTHPVTGRKALFVNEMFTDHIVDLAPAESEALLGFLCRHIAEPRFQCRFKWVENSVAMWDNRCTQHIAMWDYHPQVRSGHRVTVVGDRPV